ncbi:MAG: serine hydrolase [Leadbetterella sp.]|nr:serine hydrolase [Leadbetterella sp.]
MKKILFLLLVTVSAVAQPLPRSTPEAQGVSSREIRDFVEAWEASTAHEPHSLMVLRHGKVIAEGWWNPFGPDLLHTMYSVSKSFTATGIGFALHEGRLRLDDTVLSFFPEDSPVNPSDNLRRLRVRDLLTMSAGNDQEPRYMLAEDHWVSAFLRSNYVYEPGSRFMYNSPATYMLSAILQKVTGEKLLDYLAPRLFRPLGITGVDWEVDPRGINTGGWGLRLKTEDMAKFGQLFLQKGRWNGQQILPEEWVMQASSAKIFPPEGQRENSDWHQGYGFQMWRGRHQTFRADGAFGQNIIVLPEKDAVIITTGESSDLQGLLNLVWDKLLPAFKEGKVKKDPTLYLSLTGKLKNLSLAPQKSVSAGSITAGNLVFLETPYHSLKGLKLKKANADLEVTFVTDSLNHVIPFSDGKWALSETTLKGPYLVAGARANRSLIPRHKVAGSYGWKDPQTLVLALMYYENMHTETITIQFHGEVALVSFKNIMLDKTYKAVEDRSQDSSPRLIMRGDDMGYSHSGNLALLKSSLQGIQTSIEVIAPAPWFPEAVKMLQENPGIDVGLHFALTSEWDNVKWRPLTEAKSLRNADGYFYSMIQKNSYYPGQAIMDHGFELRDIEMELRAQIELLKKYVPRVSHISGHMGCTLFTPEVKALVRKVAAEYGLPVVDSDAVKDFGIEYIWIDSRNKSTEERIDAFIRQLDKLENHKTYVFLEHPGLDNEELRAIHHIGYENVAQDRQAVTDLFTSEKVKMAIYRKGIRLVSYREALSK